MGSNRNRTCTMDGPSNGNHQMNSNELMKQSLFGFRAFLFEGINRTKLNSLTKPIKDLEVKSKQQKEFGTTVNHGNQRDQLLRICHTILQAIDRFLTAISKAQYVPVNSSSIVLRSQTGKCIRQSRESYQCVQSRRNLQQQHTTRCRDTGVGRHNVETC